MDKKHVGLLGATSLVGECIQQQLLQKNWRITAFSRQKIKNNHAHITWLQPGTNCQSASHIENKIVVWICAAPIWVLPEYFDVLLLYGIQRIVILSSTSRFTKRASSDQNEQRTAHLLIKSENQVQTWAKINRVEWIILRPTLIYGMGRDKNITEIARFILRFGFFPLLGAAKGLRQPIHAKDVSTACILALEALNLKNCTYNLTGGETLTYRDMVKRIFSALNKRPRLIRIPLWLLQLTIPILRRIPRYRLWTAAMAERMNQDLVFNSLNTQQDLHFSPGPFILSAEDLP
ncbi:NAD(P)-dependent oxidoreductase [Nitrosomonas sp.]|uniref:NAD-dependent epimerase/dehydratase family protein n=1 Tax=Nitrosomonas sp. TaxID=42353 RepID=UPI00208920A2|nr:NAD-dependent epimerase/dehydratase family protein [Nitrosomonas sp.]GJL74840.1 MAG: epimerase [Nitrosomonas sp.]